jgi:hypothetical protein
MKMTVNTGGRKSGSILIAILGLPAFPLFEFGSGYNSESVEYWILKLMGLKLSYEFVLHIDTGIIVLVMVC